MSGDSGRREVSTFHAAALSATQFGSVAEVLSKCTLLPADSPNRRMGEVCVREAEKTCWVGIEAAYLLVPYGCSIMELNLS